MLRQAVGGGTIRAILAALSITPKTVDTHLQNAYAKIGVFSRAEAAMYAMQHGLLASFDRAEPLARLSAPSRVGV